MRARKNDPGLLLAEFDRTRAVLAKLHRHYLRFKRGDFRKLGRNVTAGAFLAEVLCDYYTCLETLFLRTSQFFENSLSPEKWHQDLLGKMTLGIKGIRPRFLSEETFPVLLEFLKFRHFKRYYFELEYDWDKLEFLESKYLRIRNVVLREISAFERFLKKL